MNHLCQPSPNAAHCDFCTQARRAIINYGKLVNFEIKSGENTFAISPFVCEASENDILELFHSRVCLREVYERQARLVDFLKCVEIRLCIHNMGVSTCAACIVIAADCSEDLDQTQALIEMEIRSLFDF